MHSFSLQNPPKKNPFNDKNTLSRKRSNSSTFQFTDNRLETIAQKNLLERISNTSSQHKEPIQLYKKAQVDYSSHQANLVSNYREEKGLWSPEPNVGSLITDGYTTVRVSSGENLHSEKLLLGSAIAEKKGNPEAIEKFHQYYPGIAAIYTEREPCSKCDTLLKKGLNDKDIVYYTVPIGPRKAMEGALHKVLGMYHDEKILAEIEHQQYEENKEQLIDIVLKEYEQAKLMGMEAHNNSRYTSRLDAIIEDIKRYSFEDILHNSKKLKQEVTTSAQSAMAQMKKEHKRLMDAM